MGDGRRCGSRRATPSRAAHRSWPCDRAELRKLYTAATVGTMLLAVSATPPTPAFADSVRNEQWYLSSLKISQAHAITSGRGIKVAVVDTGAYPHVDLRRNLLAGIDETSHSGGNGRVDENGHGTRISALIAGHARGSNGVLGIAPSSNILPARVSKTGL